MLIHILLHYCPLLVIADVIFLNPQLEPSAVTHTCLS